MTNREKIIQKKSSNRWTMFQITKWVMFWRMCRALLQMKRQMTFSASA